MASNVDIVIGAKDQASSILANVGKSVAVLGVAIAAFKGGGALADFLSASAAAFGESEDATRKLTTAINLNGEASEESIAKHNDLANALQATLNIEDEVTKGLMAQASSLGVADDKLDSVTKTAIGLSEAMGVSLDDGLKKARLALDGNFKSIEKMIPSIKALTSEEEKFEAVLSLAEKGLILKSEAADSATQADERAMLAVGEFMESVGAVVLPLQAMVYEGIEIIVTALNTAFGPALTAAGDILGTFRDNVVYGAQITATALVTAGTFIEVAWNNLGSVFEIVGASVLLTLETMRADIEQVLTVAIPAYAMWFADNFFNIFRDAGMAIVTVFQNLGTIIGEIFAGIWLVITGQQSVAEAMENIGRAAGRGLLDGFEATTQALPDIAARSMTDAEKTLNAVIDTNTEAIASDFSTKLSARLEAVNAALAPKEKETKIDKEFKMNKLDKKTTDKEKKAKLDTDIALSATESRLLTRGRVDDSSMMVATNTKKLTEQNDKMFSQLQALNRSMAQTASNTEQEELVEVS